MQQERPIHLPGPLLAADVHAAYHVIAAVLGSKLRRIPSVGTEEHEPGTGGAGPGEVQVAAAFDVSAYADEVIRSWRIFGDLRKGGDIEGDLRFQISLPAPVTIATSRLAKAAHAVALPALDETLRGALERLLAEIPPVDLAVEWIVTTEFFTLETGGWSAYLRDEFDAVVQGLVRLGDAVPQEAELGYRFSYGNLDRTHLGQQSNASRMYTFANGILGRIGRTVDWLQFDTPADRHDPDFFVPLAGLRRFVDTRLFLGLIQPGDDLDQARRRLNAASTHLPDVGIAPVDGPDFGSPDGARAELSVLRLLAGDRP